MSAREGRSWKEAEGASGSPAFRKCLSPLICRKRGGRKDFCSPPPRTESVQSSTQTAELSYPRLSQPCISAHPETNLRFFQSASEARITEWRFSFSSILLGQSVACEGNLRQGHGHPSPTPTCRTNGRGKKPEHCTSSEVQVRGCSDTTGGRKQRESFRRGRRGLPRAN